MGCMTEKQLQELHKDIESGLVMIVEKKHYKQLEAKLKEQADQCPSYMGHNKCAEAEDYAKLQAENRKLKICANDGTYLKALAKQNVNLMADYKQLEAERKGVSEKLCGALSKVKQLEADNKDYARRLLSHKKGESIKATCFDCVKDYWYVDDEPIICPSCEPKQALKGGQ